MPSRDRFAVLLYAAALAVLATFPRPVSADLVKLNNGGEIRGTLKDRRSVKTSGPVVVTTLAGGIVAVDAADVKFITRRPLKVERYETKAKQTPRTVDAQWKLAQWCRERGLRRQREECLRVILEIDPDHRPSRLALGYSKYDGEWMTRDEWHRSQGLVKYKGKYITPEELELIKKSDAVRAREREWFRKVRLWKTWLTGRNRNRRAKGLANLKTITDADAVAALARNFRGDSSKERRMFYVSLLAGMKGPKPVPALVHQSLHDADREVRYAALNAISKNQYPAAMPHFIRELKDDSVVVVRRAANGLQRVGDERAVPALIDALVTTHRYKVRVPDRRSTMSFGTNGSFAGGGSALPPQIELLLRTGQLRHGAIINYPQLNQMVRTKVVRVKYDHKNREVLTALQRITGQSFGYQERDWRLWLASTKNGQGVASP